MEISGKSNSGIAIGHEVTKTQRFTKSKSGIAIGHKGTKVDKERQNKSDRSGRAEYNKAKLITIEEGDAQGF